MQKYNNIRSAVIMCSITGAAALASLLLYDTFIHHLPVWIGVSSAILMLITGLVPLIAYLVVTKELLMSLKFDPVTGLLNRAVFNDKFKELIKRCERNKGTFHLLILDLNKFRKINDVYGHTVGNQLLTYVGTKLHDAIRPGDIIARLGSDEFAILLNDPKNEQIYTSVIEKITKTFDTPISVEGNDLYVSTSIGVASFPESASTTDKLMRAADVAMFAAKNSHSDYTVFNHVDDEKRDHSTEIPIHEIRNAIEHNEFVLYYQPKRHIKTGHVHSVECLARWNHPKHGLLGPNRFIPSMEATGLVKYLTQCVVKEATQAYQHLKDYRYDFDMSVNISPNDIIDPTTMTTIIKSIVKADMPPNRLVLEVTETAIMVDPESSFKILIALESLGIKLSIDDFGVGQSSLTYLKNFPIHEIKIDQSFVKDINTSKESHNIVKSIIELAHNLSSVTVAEGVEDEATESTIADLGCDYIQGYYLAKPMSFDDLVRWLQETQPIPGENNNDESHL